MACIACGGGADEDDARVGARLREVAILGQEAVAGVDGLGAALARGGDDRGDVEVALAASGPPTRCASSACATCRAMRSTSE